MWPGLPPTRSATRPRCPSSRGANAYRGDNSAIIFFLSTTSESMVTASLAMSAYSRDLAHAQDVARQANMAIAQANGTAVQFDGATNAANQAQGVAAQVQADAAQAQGGVAQAQSNASQAIQLASLLEREIFRQCSIR